MEIKFKVSQMIYILWPEDGLKQRPKHVVSLNKNYKTELYCDLVITHILLYIYI